MKTISSWRGVWVIVILAIGMVTAPLLATAGEQSERGAKSKPARGEKARQQRPRIDLKVRANTQPARGEAAPQRRGGRPPVRDRGADRGPRAAASRPGPPHHPGRPPQCPLPEVVRRILAGGPTDLFSDVMAKLLSDVAVKLLSGNKAELLSGNETELLSGNETELLSGNEPEILSGNRAQILSGNAITLFSGNHLSITITDSGNNSGNNSRNGNEVTETGEEFSALDSNGDGRLSLEEFRARKMGRMVRKARKQFRHRDVDSDGGLSLREFALSR